MAVSSSVPSGPLIDRDDFHDPLLNPHDGDVEGTAAEIVEAGQFWPTSLSFVIPIWIIAQARLGRTRAADAVRADPSSRPKTRRHRFLTAWRTHRAAGRIRR